MTREGFDHSAAPAYSAADELRVADPDQRSAESARSVTDAVRAHFGRYRIPPEQYRGLVDVELSPDPDDRVQVAACLGGGVDVLPTRNTVDMPVARLANAGVEVMTADAFLVRSCGNGRPPSSRRSS